MTAIAGSIESNPLSLSSFPLSLSVFWYSDIKQSKSSPLDDEDSDEEEDEDEDDIDYSKYENTTSSTTTTQPSRHWTSFDSANAFQQDFNVDEGEDMDEYEENGYVLDNNQSNDYLLTANIQSLSIIDSSSEMGFDSNNLENREDYSAEEGSVSSLFYLSILNSISLSLISISIYSGAWIKTMKKSLTRKKESSSNRP